VFGSHWLAGGGVVGIPCQPDAGGGGAGAGGGGVAGVPCQLDGGGGAGAGGGGADAAGGGADAGGGSLANFVPDTQHVCGTGAGTALFSQQRAFGPCTPAFMYVNAAHWGSSMQADWHSPGLDVGRSKLR
jgi:hypothetical protein